MKIAVTGSTGLIGSALVPHLADAGHEVVRLVRGQARTADAVPWDPDRGMLDAAALEGVDAVVNLAGENIAKGRWTTAKKRRILESRVKSTTLLATTMASLQRRPRCFVSASAVGYYASSGDRIITESDPAGEDFLSKVCLAWEAATQSAEASGIRTVRGRIGVVLSAEGGALAGQLPLFRWGLGGRLGSGRQYVPWIAVEDLVRAINYCLTNESLRGPVNLTAPNPVTNLEFTKTLGNVLKRPTILPAPAFALRLALGEMADQLLLPSLRVVPERLLRSGFRFAHPELKVAIRHVLGQ
jgi:uncharacterized protein